MEIPSWLVIGAVAVGLGAIGGIVPPSGLRWFKRLKRPRWLTFEKLIPLIWTVVFICGAWSAYIVWQSAPGTSRIWTLMGVYLLLELVTLSYNTAMLWVKSLRVGVMIGAIGFLIAIGLTLAVWRISGWAALLLVPYLLWSPIGTYTTWEMMRLNPQDR